MRIGGANLASQLAKVLVLCAWYCRYLADRPHRCISSSPIQLPPRLPEQIKTTQIAHPPQHAPNLAPQVVLNQDINKAIRDPRNRVYESRTIHKLPVDSCKSGKSHGPDEKGVVLDGVCVCRLIAPQHVELFLRNLARLDGCVAVLGQVLAWRGVMVDAVPLFQRARRKDTVCKYEVEGEKSRGVVGCGESGRSCERGHGWVRLRW